MASSMELPPKGWPSAPQTFVFSDVHTDYAAGIFVEFARQLSARGHRILFLHPPPATSCELVDRFHALGAVTRAVPALARRSPWAVANEIERAVAAAGVSDPILVACESVPMRGQALLASRRHWRTLFHVLLLRTGNDLRSYLRERIDAILVRRSGGVVLGCSRGVCEYMTERLAIDAEKSAIFQTGSTPPDLRRRLPIGRFRRTPMARHRCRRSVACRPSGRLSNKTC